MSNFAKGMQSIGQLFPTQYQYPNHISHNSVWNDVGKSFKQAGNDLKAAIKECSNAEPEKKQAN